MFAQTILKLSQAAHSVSVRLSTKASSSRISRTGGPMKVRSISFAMLMLGNFLFLYWNHFEFVLAMAVTKHFINPSSMWKGGRDVFIGLRRGMCWTLPFPNSHKSSLVPSHT